MSEQNFQNKRKKIQKVKRDEKINIEIAIVQMSDSSMRDSSSLHLKI